MREKNRACLFDCRLTLQSITRSHLGANYTCQARNTDLIEPREASVSLDLNRELIDNYSRQRNDEGSG